MLHPLFYKDQNKFYEKINTHVHLLYGHLSGKRTNTR
jgi:hypothetical protein